MGKIEARNTSMAIVSAMHVCAVDNRLYTHFSFGRIVDALAGRYSTAYLCVPVNDRHTDDSSDYGFKQCNIALIKQPFYHSSFSALKNIVGITKAYYTACSSAENVFVRGMIPYVALFYIIAWFKGCNVCHWIVGNPVALMKSHVREGKIKDYFSLLYAWQDRVFTILGRRIINGSFICNGEELGKIYKSPKTRTVVSTTLIENEFFVREDTCQNKIIKILFIGFIRPEKGVEYLFEAVGKLKITKDWKLIVIGPTDKFPAYKQKLDSIAAQMKIADKLEWAGYVSYGSRMFEYMRDSDVFILPTLSEGTPRVLIEARANSLPVISTTVGGIPTSLKSGFDGILVPPKNADAIFKALQQIIDDGGLRRQLIKNGFETAKQLTVDKFIDKVMSNWDKNG